MPFDKFESADFKFDNSFLKMPSKTHTNRTFLVPNLRLFCFCAKISNLTNSRMVISNIKIVFLKMPPKHIHIKHLCYQRRILGTFKVFLFLHKNLQFGKFEVSDFRYEDGLLKLHPRNTQIMHFWSQIWTVFVLHQTILFDKFEGADFY